MAQEHTPVERALRRDGTPGRGRPLPSASLQRERTLEGYLLGQEPPAWMRRARAIERLTREHERALRAAREALLERHASPAAFAAAWTRTVGAWDFAEVNHLIDLHNEWYPVERRLPVDPRTGDYVTVGGGRSYRRERLGPEWALRRFPATRG